MTSFCHVRPSRGARPASARVRVVLRWLLSWSLVVSCVMSWVTGAPAGLPETIERVKASVVSVGSLQPLRSPPAHFAGTGFAVADGLHVVTNAHVARPLFEAEAKAAAAGAPREQVGVFAGRGTDTQFREARLLAMDAEHDLAILRINGAPLPVLTLGDSSGVREGQLFAFTGFPIGPVLGLFPVTHLAMISSVTPIAIPRNVRNLDAQSIRRLRSPYVVFQLDATAYPGNSGSPLYDRETGIVFAILNSVFVKATKETVIQQPSGITYAIPSEFVRELLNTSGIKAGGGDGRQGADGRLGAGDRMRRTTGPDTGGSP